MNANAKKRYEEIKFPFTCPITNRQFDTGKGLSIYLTKSLKINHSEYYDKYINHRNSECFFCGNKGDFISVSRGYRNLCNNEDCVKKSFYSNTIEGLMYKYNCSMEEASFKLEENKSNIAKSIIKAQEKLRKEDPLWDKKRSRNCKEFWIEKGYSEEESILKSKEVMDDIHKKSSKKFKDNPKKYASKYPTKIEYYLEKGYSEEEGIKIISERQKTFSLQICIEKYGQEEGLKIWTQRQDKWIDNLNSKTDEEKIEINKKKLSGAQYSPISQKLFWDIYNLVGNEKTKFAELNKEFFLLNDDKMWFAYDYVDMIRKKCIEFNGDFWHCNPNQFKDNDIHRVKNKLAKEIWEIDFKKNILIESKGYSVLTIWESEYRKYPKETLDKCLNFLNIKQN